MYLLQNQTSYSAQPSRSVKSCINQSVDVILSVTHGSQLSMTVGRSDLMLMVLELLLLRSSRYKMGAPDPKRSRSGTAMSHYLLEIDDALARYYRQTVGQSDSRTAECRRSLTASLMSHWSVEPKRCGP